MNAITGTDLRPHTGVQGSASGYVPDSADAVDRFLLMARMQPLHPAVVTPTATLSYGELEQRVRLFAAQFARVAAPSVLVALPQGADAYAAMLAAGLAGGHYTPLNVAAPPAKLRQVAEQLRPDFVVGAPALTATLAVGDAVCIDPAQPAPRPPFEGTGERHVRAYTIFTSGSTGTPKGVMVPRAALNHYVQWLGESVGFGPRDRVSQFPNIAFDLSVMDIYGALCFGASLHPITGQGDRLMPARMIEREAITVAVFVPSVISLMMRVREANARRLGTVRRFVLCGEALRPAQAAALFAACPEAVVQNTSGPTEATVSMTSVELRAADYGRACGATVAIGDAIPGMALHLVGGPHPDEGEIVITGPQLAAGYLGDPARTAAAFREVLVEGVPVLGYHTGDWAERRGGQVFFRERVDFQVKVHGFRIELDEIADAFARCGWPVVCVFKHGEGLAAVVERGSGAEPDLVVLRHALLERIEAHAVPERIRVIDAMPRNDNDKVDRGQAIAWFEATA